MALRAMSPLGFFPYDVATEDVFKVPMILAISEHAILWRQNSQICVNSAEFPAVARRLLRQDSLSNPSFPWLGTSLSDINSCFLTPLVPMTSRQLAHHATCVLPVPVDGYIETAAFATATRLFVPIAACNRGLAIVSFTSSSPLFDGYVTYEVSMHINYTDYIPNDVSLVVNDPGPSGYPDHICLLSYENWHGYHVHKKCSFRYVFSRSRGEAISSECVMEHPVEYFEIFDHGSEAAKQIAGLAGRCVLSYHDPCLNYLKTWIPEQEHRIFEPVKLFTSEDESVKEFTLLLLTPGGGRAKIKLDLKIDGDSIWNQHLLKNSISAASSRIVRVVARLKNTVYTGFFGGALSGLEEASRAACHSHLIPEQKKLLSRTNAFDFISFLEFCASYERRENCRAI